MVLTKEERVEIMNKARAVKMEKALLKKNDVITEPVKKAIRKKKVIAEEPEKVEVVEVIKEPKIPEVIKGGTSDILKVAKVVKSRKKEVVNNLNLDDIHVKVDEEKEYSEVIIKEEVLPPPPKQAKKKVIKKVIQEVFEESSDESVELQVEQRIIPREKKEKKQTITPIKQKVVNDGFSLFDY